MSAECREALGRLTSAELAKLRVEPWELMDARYEQRMSIRALKAAFDAKLRRPLIPDASKH
jgi:hypothetical protein